MTTQSIIVYRNPAEAAFWEMITGPAILPLIAAFVVFIIAVCLTHSILTRGSGSGKPWKTYTAMAVAAIAAIGTFRYLYI